MNAVPKLSFVICTQPRSGSWLLAEALECTGIAGRPREYFNDLFEEELRKKWEITDYATYFEKVLEMGTTTNGVFGIKLLWVQFESMLLKLRGLPEYTDNSKALVMTKLFPNLRYIWLTRIDKVRQAISHYKAIQSGKWWRLSDQQISDRGLSEGGEISPDFAAIQELERLAESYDAAWGNYFTSNGITPIKVVYEEFCQSFETTVTRVLADVGIGCTSTPKVRHPRLRKQADAVSERWVKDYGAFKCNCSN